jgi:predicted transcriptional regulator
MGKTLTEMTVGIAAAQATRSSMSAVEMETFLTTTFNTLKKLKDIEANVSEQAPEESAGPAIDPKRSILKNKVICLECGEEFKILTNRHLEQHNMDSKEYRQKYGLKTRQPLAAKSLSEKRSAVAKKHKLGDRLQLGRKKALERKTKALQRKAQKATPKPDIKESTPAKTILRKAESTEA